MKVIKIFFDYLFFRDMGNLGEKWLVSAFIWFVIIGGLLLILNIIA